MTLLVENHDIVVPGQKIAYGDYAYDDSIIKEGSNYHSSIVGLFIPRGNKLRVRELAGRYVPEVGNFIIGYIEEARLTSWIVNIRGPYQGMLLASNAIRGRFDPIKDDTRKIYNEGDAIKADIISFDRTREPHLSTANRGLGKLHGGRIVEINPKHIPRLIGKNGSMISMIKDETKAKIIIGQNGRVWVNANNLEKENLAIKAIQQISRQAHIEGLTDRIKTLLKGGE